MRSPNFLRRLYATGLALGILFFAGLLFYVFYLRPSAIPATVVPVSTPSAAPAAVPPQVLQRGAQVYEMSCLICHGPGGEGVPDYAPPLQGNRAVVASDLTQQVRQILYGSSVIERGPDYPWPAWMPAFGELLTDEEIAAVATYQRNSWGNRAPAVHPEQVHTVRRQETEER